MTAEVKAYYRHGEPTILTSDADVDALLAAALGETLDNSVIALYSSARPRTESNTPDHEMRVAVNSKTGAAGVRYHGSDGEAPGIWYAAGATSERGEVLYWYAGNEEEWPADSEVPLNAAAAAIKEFLAADGARPAGPEWKPWPADVR